MKTTWIVTYASNYSTTGLYVENRVFENENDALSAFEEYAEDIKCSVSTDSWQYAEKTQYDLEVNDGDRSFIVMCKEEIIN